MRKRLAVFAFSIILMLVTVSFFGFGEVFGILFGSNLYFVFLGLICQLVIIFLYGCRFKIVSSKYKHISIKEALHISIIGNFVSLVTPIAKIGGQPLMIYMLKDGIGNEKSSAVVIMDTVIDFVVSIFALIFILVAFYSSMPYVIFVPLLLFAIITFSLVAGFIKMFLSKTTLARITDWLIEKIRRFKKIDKIFHTRIFQASFRTFLKDKRIMSLGALISAIIKIFEFLRIWIIFAAIQIFLPVNVLLIIWAVMIVLLTIPWLPGSLGLFEFGAASAFVIFGLSPSAAAGGILLDRFISLWFVIILSLIVIWFSRNTLSQIMRISENKA